ncbi:hypothetical protein HJC23_004871 [Cyclotella cryptica]|uniref:Major facilitator superfamily (MFS) profile domain-containing protein n=1 Tax=Cyclotella cryptica TaxID=29204 RepID=A0ABD3P810_9STRA|eukprot:CCRYP_017002-RC/>CCRYP_017002-RC protein AED:0.09 eAED:0.09 QI:513/1/1/1/0.25/0.2/5/234/511
MLKHYINAISIRGGDTAASSALTKTFRRPSSLSVSGGAVTTTTPNQISETSHTLSKMRTATLNALHQTSFLIVVSTSIVAFSPLPSLTRHLAQTISTKPITDATSQSPQSKAIQLLSILSSISASIELFASPLVGVWIDSWGRKVPTIALYSLIVLGNACVVLHPCVWSISFSKVVNGAVGGFLVVVANAVIADFFAVTTKKEKSLHGQDQMGTAMGRQAAAVSLGFLLGSLIGVRLMEIGERLAYGCSLVFSILAVLNGAFQMMDSAELSRKNNDDAGVISHSHSWDHETLRQKVLEAPLSSVQLLFYYGSKMRTLALLLMLQSAPMYMGDVFQLFAKEYWGLTPKAFGSIIALFGVLGIVSNLSLPLLLNNLGLRNVSLLSIASSLFFPLTTILTTNYKAVIAAGCAGLYSSTQKIGTSAAMTSLASELGVRQGQLQGEKASMLALFRILCPVVYGMLYLTGKEWSLEKDNGMMGGTLSVIRGWIGTKLPFVLNIILGIVAFVITWNNI